LTLRVGVGEETMNKINDFITRFGFHVAPFTCEIRVEEQFYLEFSKQVMDELLSTVKKRMSAALIAPSGTGKTKILRTLVSKLPETRYRISYIKVTDLSKREFCREIAAATGSEAAGDYPSLVRKLQNRFTSSIDIDGLRPVLILDECHDIRADVLGIIRILTNFEMDSRLVVSIILSGQSPLLNLLRHPNLEDVAHRLTHCATLRLLSRKEITQYMQHRCKIAGSSDCPFDTGALDAVYEIGRGNMRATDYIALKSLEIAHEEDSDVVNSNHVTKSRGML